MGTVANDGVFRFLANAPATARNLPAVATPDDPSRDYYREAGAHPDIVERLWDQLGKKLPALSKALVFGTPALVHQASGVVLAFALGTEYALRLPRRIWRETRPDGLRTVALWTRGDSTDIQQECGKEWVFGSFAADEIAWCEEASRECSDDQSSPAALT